MRITQSMIMRNTLKRLGEKTGNLDKLQQIISTGKNVQKASDDPVAYTKAARFKTSLQQNTQYLDNIQNANGWLEFTDLALEQIRELVVQGKEIAQRGSDGIIASDTLEVMHGQVDGMIEQALSIANQSYVGRGLFVGSAIDVSPPFTIASNEVTYNGDNESLNRRVSQNLEVQINVTGQDVLDSGALQGLIALRTALENEDQEAIRAQIDVLGAANEQMLGISANVGSSLRTLALAEERINQTILNLNEFISDEEDADLVEALVKYESEQTAYSAALRSSAEILQLNILQFI